METKCWPKFDSVWKRTFGQNLTFKSAAVTLKIRLSSSKFNQLFAPSNNVSVQVWSKSTHWFGRYGAEKADF